jgi:hypothetical protein
MVTCILGEHEKGFCLLPRIHKYYAEYLKTNEHSEKVIHKLNKNCAFRGFVAASIFNPKAQCRLIEDLVILPVQRIRFQNE